MIGVGAFLSLLFHRRRHFAPAPASSRPPLELGAGETTRSPGLEQFLPLVCNTGERQFTANVKASIARGLEQLVVLPAHKGVAVVVAGGPSLNRCEAKLRWHQEQGHHIVALNGTAAWLTERGISIDCHVLLDARESTARFVNGKAGRYLIASQCHPSTFDAVGDDRRITLWHPNVAGISELAGDGAVMIGGGTTVGLQTLPIMFAIGFRGYDLYGFDSCYADKEGHAYAQPENDGEKLITVNVGGREFTCAPWMAHQADEFRNVLWQLTESDCELRIHGDGLIQHIARLMMQPMDPSASCYDLARAPASWDFACWLINAEMERIRRGAPAPLKVAFSPGPWQGFRADDLPLTPDERQGFLDNVLRPLLPLIGAVEDPVAIHGREHQYLFGSLCDAARRGEDVPRYKARDVDVAEVDRLLEEWGYGAPIVITLRESHHWPTRNSNTDAWIEFAKRRKAEGYSVIFVRDTARAAEPVDGFRIFPVASLAVTFRTALYERALCNLFVANGPAALAILGRKPFLMFKPLVDGWRPGTPEWWRDMVGVPKGEQFPWCDNTQRVVWTDDTLDEIEAAWAALKPTLDALERQ